MAAAPYIFPAQQAEFLRALRDGRYRAPARTRNVPTSTTLVARMPPVQEQALRGTCVANAATAMLEYYEDCKIRLSVQYLFAATKELERAGLERNLSRLRLGDALDPAFEHALHSKLLQLRMLADANGGINSPAMRPYLTQFEETVRTRYEAMDGCLLRSCFNVLEYRGTCRYSIWPYAGVSAAPLFGSGDRIAYPPGADDDAKKHRVLSGLYLLPAPNNVDEIRRILAGANDRRPMPVCVTVSFFKGCDGETFTFPQAEETEDGLVAKDAWLGVHGMLIVGYVDSASVPGGGYFIVRNSRGEAWGNRGYGKLPYAYVACFALEAGTILQDLVDYTGDGYGGFRAGEGPVAPRRRRRWLIFLNLLVAVALVAGTWAAVTWFTRPEKPLEPAPPPYAEVTVYGRNSNVDVALPAPWNEVKGMAIDGGRVFRLPVKTRAEVDAIRRLLDAEPTLREKRGKPLTYDLVSFFDLVADDLATVKKTVGMFRAENFLVRVEGESNGVLRVSTVSPAGLKGRLKEVFHVQAVGNDRLVLEPIRTDEPAATNAAPPTGATDVPSAATAPVEVLPQTASKPVISLSPASPETNSLSVVVQELDHLLTNMPPVVVQEGKAPVYAVTDEPSPIVAVTDAPPPVAVDVTNAEPPRAEDTQTSKSGGRTDF